MDLDRRTLVKVPELTAVFWLIKILSTGMGETTSDFFVHRVGITNKPALVGVVALTGVVLGIALVVQLTRRRYQPQAYWFAVVAVSVAGTLAADGVHFVLGVPYLVSSIGLAILLAVIFSLWYRSERDLSIHGIVTLRRELYYWAVVMATFALGTAVGDTTAVTLHLGYFSSGLLFAAAFIVPAVAYRWLRLNGVVAFWIAYILTRPLGASFADWLGVSPQRGGLDLGTGPISVCAAIVIALLVGYLVWSGKDAAPTEIPAPARP